MRQHAATLGLCTAKGVDVFETPPGRNASSTAGDLMLRLHVHDRSARL
jgi:hypothetical protein